MTVIHATRFSAAEHWLRTHRRSTIAGIVLYLGAASLVVSGVDHIQQYYVDDYSVVTWKDGQPTVERATTR